MSSDVLTRTFQVNVVGPALIAQAYLPYLEKPGVRGVILNMTSGLASIGLDIGDKCPSYSISKIALNMLVRSDLAWVSVIEA
jgi:NAD(P)-dependent dehydrogenase (short-subunit alcohol dehydrogenase family)